MKAIVATIFREKRFGFCVPVGETARHFFHHADVMPGTDFDTMYVGQVVLCDIVPSVKGPRVGKVRAATT